MARKILVSATPAAGAADTIALARHLGAAMEAEVVLAGVAVVPMMAERDVFASAKRAVVERRLDRMRPDDLIRVVVTDARSVARGLHELIESEQADLLVIAQSRRDGLERLAHGDLAMSVLHGSPCPIAVAATGYADRPVEPRPLVAVAIDGGEETDLVLDHAVELARSMTASLRIVAVAETTVGTAVPVWMDEGADSGYADAVRAETYDVLRRAETRVGERVPATTKLMQGFPGEELIRFAASVDLLVMGSRAYGTLGRVLVGSTAGRVINAAPCPVFLIPRAVKRLSFIGA